MSPLRTALVALRVLLPRPRLWPTAARQVARFAPDRWWTRPPFLPLPDPALLEFRATTQYGDPDRTADAGDVLAWLDWCRA
ncbi:MAG: hypothetical protein AAGA37_03770 [Actinomycetota bacterium]